MQDISQSLFWWSIKDLEGEAQEILKQYPDVPVYTAEYELLAS